MTKQLVFTLLAVSFFSSLCRAQLPFTGTITLEGYDIILEQYEGVMDIDLATGATQRVLNGLKAWRHPQGKIIFLQGCGDRVHRVAIADLQGLITPVSPCSSEIPNSGYVATDFDFSRLSPDEGMFAVEAYNYNSDESSPGESIYWGAYHYSVVVFNLSKQQEALFEGYWAPEWLPDGRLVMGGATIDSGIYVTDSNLQNVTRIDGGRLNGPVNNLDAHPSGERVAFEYNQQIWQINLDGSGLEEVFTASKYLKFPTWSPDGKVLAFLAKEQEDYFENAIYFYEVDTGQSYTLDMSSQFEGIVPNGPLSWRE